jgi:4-amino-4-deoxychorismate lyase
MKYCSINGKSITNLDVTDRGLAYGDGIFTTAKIEAGRVLLLLEHIERLISGCKHINFKCPDSVILKDQLVNAASMFSKGVLKVIITAGSGGRGYSREGLNPDSSNIIIMIFDFPHQYVDQALNGITLGISKQKIAISPMLGGIKHLNRLEQVLLRQELDERIEDDLIVRNTLDEVIEATSANLFYWLDKKLYTPDLGFSGVNGLIRQGILDSADDIVVRKTTLDDLKLASSMFICNCIMGIMPVNRFDNKQLSIQPVISLKSILKV